jgi:plastocyanin
VLRRELNLVAGLTIVLAACAAPAPVAQPTPDQPGAGTPAVPSTPAPPTTPTPQPATAPPVTPAPATPTPAPVATPVSGEASVSVFDFGFSPASLEVTAGTSVTWTNDGVVPHTVTFEGGPDSGTMDGGATFEHTFDTAGQFSYICRFHPTMRGTITVGD